MKLHYNTHQCLKKVVSVYVINLQDIYREAISDELPIAAFIVQNCIVGVVSNDGYFIQKSIQKSYALGVIGLSPYQKITTAL